MPSSTAVGIFTTVGLFVVMLRLVFRTRVPKGLLNGPLPPGLKLPPGPPGDFLIGNLRQVPSHHEWETYSEWHKKYGDLVCLNVFGTCLLYINSTEMAYELLDKRSAIYSDRPIVPMFELAGMPWSLALIPYGERWRQHRHAFHQKFNSRVLSQYTPVQTKHSRNLLYQLHNSKDNWESLIRHSIGAAIMEITYGIDILPKNDPYIATAEFVLGLAGEIGPPSSYLVNTIPILQRLPEWFPGAGFQKKAKIWKKRVLDMPTIPFQWVKNELAAGTAKPSLTATLLEEAYAKAKDQKVSEGEEELIRNLAGVVYGAGAETTSCTLEIFILAMILYPEAQLTAQKEFDAVIGPNRLPSFEDRSQLPYLVALCKETLRWHPVATIAIPHRLMQDDVVGQYFIPAGTIVQGNAWGILHSEAMYGPDTMEFKPERFLHSPDMKDPAAAFGFGRRACPGRAMAESSLFITIASILHVFNIILPPGALRPDANAFIPGMLSRPAPFKCSFVPRSVAAEALIKEHH
ncbi:cytochrome P450 [Hysterangium stoloniferum]|nr:cytochrome P450 [Hysterangium stoloniferum]